MLTRMDIDDELPHARLRIKAARETIGALRARLAAMAADDPQWSAVERALRVAQQDLASAIITLAAHAEFAAHRPTSPVER